MKVCFISDSLVREREIIAGLNKKTDFLLVYPYYPSENVSQEDVESFCQENNVPLIMHDFTTRRASSIKGISADLTLIKKIKKFDPDVIYIENLGSPYLAVFYRLFFGNKKIIISLMDYKLHQRSKGQFKFSEKFYKFMQMKFYKNFHFFSYSQEKLFKTDFPKKRSFTVRIFLVGTDLPKREDFIKDNSIINFLFFGRIFYYKGVDVLIKASNILAKKYKNFRVTIAGSSDTWEQDYLPLIEDKSKFDLQVRYIGKDELPDLFQNANFFMVPYREVTQSGPLLRAYNYDLIPIGSDEEGFLEYIDDDKNGFIFKNESYEDLADVMEKALLLSDDEKKRITENILKFKEEEFDINHVVKKYMDMFDEVIGGLK